MGYCVVFCCHWLVVDLGLRVWFCAFGIDCWCLVLLRLAAVWLFSEGFGVCVLTLIVVVALSGYCSGVVCLCCRLCGLWDVFVLVYFSFCVSGLWFACVFSCG